MHVLGPDPGAFPAFLSWAALSEAPSQNAAARLPGVSTCPAGASHIVERCWLSVLTRCSWSMFKQPYFWLRVCPVASAYPLTQHSTLAALVAFVFCLLPTLVLLLGVFLPIWPYPLLLPHAHPHPQSVAKRPPRAMLPMGSPGCSHSGAGSCPSP